jgi:tRNA G18 (ribose-2'-O)-methylase SpoU
VSILRIETLDDPRLGDYRGLTDAALAKTRSRFIAESTVVVRRALASGAAPVSFLVDERHGGVIDELNTQHPDTPLFVGPAPVLEELTGFHLHRGALGAFDRPAPADLDALLEGARRVVVLEDVAEHTNVGAIFRSAAGLGIDAVLLSPRSADPLYRRAIRVSMGTVFSQPWARLDAWPDGIAALKRHGFEVHALELTDDAIGIDELAERNPQRLALVLGTEGAGIRPETLGAVDGAVLIPMREGVSSLNVGAAAAIALWELRAR